MTPIPVALGLHRASGGAGGSVPTFVGAPVGVTVAGRTFTLSVLDVGLACCAVEFAAAMRQVADGTVVPAPAAPGSPVPTVMVVSGTLTDVLAPGVLRWWQRLPEPKLVVSFGACATSGGPYWDSYSVTKGVDQLLPVDLYVPGCPPRPEALLDALARLLAAAA